MNVGIDSISFYTTNYYLDLKSFATNRGQEISKFYDDLGQRKMSVAPPNEDIVTLAANAACHILNENDVADIEMVLFATETGTDLSKAAATYIHRLFNLPKRCRVIELKQACYSATFGLQMGLSWLRQNAGKKVLLLAIGPEAGFCTREAMDFWRPNYLDCALVDGRLSCDVYMRFAEETWQQYSGLTGRKFFDHDRFCYHVPLAKLVEKTHRKLARINGIKDLTIDQLDYQIGKSLIYNREVGNCYTASLYLSIISLLENVSTDLAGKLIGLYSYGSGSVGEFFSARVVDGYQRRLIRGSHQTMLAARQELSFAEYEDFYRFKMPIDGGLFELHQWQTGKFRLKEIKQHQRVYEKVE